MTSAPSQSKDETNTAPSRPFPAISVLFQPGGNPARRTKWPTDSVKSDQITEAIANMIASDFQPFSMILSFNTEREDRCQNLVKQFFV